MLQFYTGDSTLEYIEYIEGREKKNPTGEKSKTE